MDWLINYAGRSAMTSAQPDVPMNYSYLFGIQSGPERHDPHIHRQASTPDSDLLKLADIIRERPLEGEAA
jgi:hypothetical protein